MDSLNLLITSVNDFLWTYILIGLLVFCGIWFSFKIGFAQFRNIGEMIRLLGEGLVNGKPKKGAVSSFQAFCITVASRVGTGNLAGVATAVAIGGPSALFWMWLMALIGSASAFIESTLAQIYKRKGKNSFIGGPAYYMERGLNKRWMGVLFAVIICITFGLVFNSVQSNTMAFALYESFEWSRMWVGVVITVVTLLTVFGGVHRIAIVSSVLVPVMAVVYIAISLFIVISNISLLPAVMKTILAGAFGLEQVAGGAMGAAIMQGVRRGLFSNEAGMGSAPNAAATADITHPVKQGYIQALSVFTDTLIICSCTAFIILISDVPLDGSVQGINLTQMAMADQLGSFGSPLVSVAVLLFAFSSIVGNYYYGEANIRFITKSDRVLSIYRIMVGAMVMIGSVVSLELVWNMVDVTMAIMAIINIIAILLLGDVAIAALKDYNAQKRAGVKSPTFKADSIKDSIKGEVDFWE